MNTSHYYIPEQSPNIHYQIDGKEIRYIKADKMYCKLHMKDKVELAPIGISELERILHPEQYCRIHRSYIVQIERVEKFTANSVFIEGEELPMSLDYSYEFKNKIQILTRNQSKKKPSKGFMVIAAEFFASFLGEIL